MDTDTDEPWHDDSCLGDGTPLRLYVAVDALLSPGPVASGEDAMEHFVEDRTKPVHERDLDCVRAGLAAAIKAVGP